MQIRHRQRVASVRCRFFDDISTQHSSAKHFADVSHLLPEQCSHLLYARRIGRKRAG
jgi:hypothetical protein